MKTIELDLLKQYLHYRISLLWASGTGYYKHKHYGFLKCCIFKDQIMSFEEWKERPIKEYLQINCE